MQTADDAARCDATNAMHKLVFEVSDANHFTLQEPVFLEDLSELPIAVMQAMEDFLDANDRMPALPIVISAHWEHQHAPQVRSFEELQATVL